MGGDGSAERAGGDDGDVGLPPGWVVAGDGAVEATPSENAEDEGVEDEGGEEAEAGSEPIALAAPAGAEASADAVADRTALAREVLRRAGEARHSKGRRGLPTGRSRRERKPQRTWGQRLVLAAGTLTVLVFSASAVGIGYLYRKVEQIPRVELGHVLAEPVASGEARNVLLVGLDDTEGVSADDPVHNGREDGPPLADTIMILRIDPAEQNAQVLSLPRDLWVTYPESQASARINTSIWRGDGSPDVLIGLIDDYLGIPIHNYVQIDFEGFRQLVEEIDGVPVYFERPGRDRNSGLHVYESGCVMLDAADSLAYVRSRHYDDYIDGEWTREGLSDLARVERQQAFIRHTVDRAVSQGARNPGTLNSMVNASVDTVALDDELSVSDLFDLGQRFRSFDPDALQSYVLPTEELNVGGAEVLEMDEQAAEPILDRFRGDPGPTDDGGRSTRPSEGDDPLDDVDEKLAEGLEPWEVSLTVLNGSGQSGQATEVAAELDEAGFVIVSRDNAGQFGQAETEIQYPPGEASEAAYVERWLASGAQLVETTDVAGVTVVTGEDWAGVLDTPVSSATSDSDDDLWGFVTPLFAGLSSSQDELDDSAVENDATADVESTDDEGSADDGTAGDEDTGRARVDEETGEISAPNVSC